jgi:thiamine pyrophosphokinase
MDETVIVVTGAESLHPDAVTRLPRNGIVIAADGALDHALAAGLTPAGLVGDLDSISPAGLAWAEAHATIQRHDPDKDRTDTELALAMAADFNPARLVMVSGGGDRLDHTFAAIGALGQPMLTSIPIVEGWWGSQHIRVLHGPGRLSFEVVPGTTISLLAMQGRCKGVTITGVEWPLDGERLAGMVGRGVSNLATDEQIVVAVSEGVVTIFTYADATTSGEQPS